MAAKRVRESPESSASAKDEILAFALASGMTQVEAALQAGVVDRTVRRKLQDPSFRALIADHRRRMVDQAFGTLVGSSNEAFKVLRRLLDDPSPATQLAAAKAIGALVVSIGSYHSLEERIVAIEARLTEASTNRWSTP
jgi:hypothetical protein